MAFKKIHLKCPDCGSSDGLCVNNDESTKCFACGVYKPSNTVVATYPLEHEEKALTGRSDAFKGHLQSQSLLSGVVIGSSERRITLATATAYNVMREKDVVIFPYYNEENRHIANKVRTDNKEFRSEGVIKESLLFGQQLFSKGGKYVTIVEGEWDALAAYQMLGSKYPVISIKSGAQAALKDCKEQFKWIDSFDNVIICFDNDDPGQQAAKKVAELFGNKSKIFKGKEGFKDACDYLSAKAEQEWVSRWWAAEEYRPEGIVTISDIKERLLTPPEPGTPWAFPTLTELTYGRRRGELYAFGAGVGVGKTDVFTQQIAYDIDTLKMKVGVIYLEQNVVETVQRVVGKIDQRLYHVPDAQWTREQYIAGIEKLEKQDRLYMMEHFGAMDWATIKSIIKFFNKAYDIDHIYLDHLTALSANEQDERRALDGIMADMASLAQELGIVIHFISHLTTPDGKPHEEGGRVMEKHFTGSRAIARWSHYMFGLERNKQHEDPVQRQLTTFRVLKDRHTGRATGIKFGLLYNKDSGILSESTLTDEDSL